MKENPLYNNPLSLYNMLLLGPLAEIYTARKQTELKEWQLYSNLLIDKFAIHSSTFFHLSSGIVEHKKSGETRRMKGYDLFTVNTTFRVIIETYTSFNHIFVEPITEEEKYFRFLLWKLDGLYLERKYEVESNDFEGAEAILKSKELEIGNTIQAIENTDFAKIISDKELAKIFIPTKQKSNWRFKVENQEIRPLKIIELVKQCCGIRAFVNTYKHSSIHTHSNFPAIEEFKRTRNKFIPQDYTDPITRLAIFLTCFVIYDICKIDKNAQEQLDRLPEEKEFIVGLANSIKQI